MPTVVRGTATGRTYTEAGMPTKDRTAFDTKQRPDPVAKDAKAEDARDKAADDDAGAADKRREAADAAAFYREHPSHIGVGLAEEAATAEAMADRTTDGVIHVPDTVEEHAEIANKEQAQINEALGLDQAADPDAKPLTGGPPGRRVIALDKPLVLAQRHGYIVDHPDVVTDSPLVRGPQS
jgi:hypothetical protein